MVLERLAEFRASVERTGADDDLGIPLSPVGKCCDNHLGGAVARLFNKGHARTGEKPLRLDRVGQGSGILAQIGGGHAAEAHFLFGAGAEKGGDHLLPSEGHTHGVGAIDQKAGAMRLWPGEIAGGIAGRKFHSGRSGAAASRRVIN